MNKRFLINAGPTYEAIDPVRFIGNHSSGKMGMALARAAADEGAEVILILGPGTQQMDYPSVDLIRVVSAEEMYRETLKRSGKVDVVILAAAVSDYTPVKKQTEKMKRGEGALVIELKPTRDIAAAVGREKRKNQIVAGFALETEEGLEQARKKLFSKNLDLIVLNSLADPGAGFAHDTNKVTILDRENPPVAFGLKTKDQVARDILNMIYDRMTQSLG